MTASVLAAEFGDERVPGRLWGKVAPQPDGCWHWTASRTQGYGACTRNGRSELAHRVFYALLVGPLADPRHIHVDHLCHNADDDCGGGTSCRHRRCVNPAHLEAVTNLTNSMRSWRTQVYKNATKTHCVRGHEFTPANTRIQRNGRRRCIECDRAFSARNRDRMQARGLTRKGTIPADRARAVAAAMREVATRMRAEANELDRAARLLFPPQTPAGVDGHPIGVRHVEGEDEVE